MSIHAFVDESTRRDRYILCAVAIEPTQLDGVRRLMRELCLPGQRRWHFKLESPRRRRQILSAVVDCGAARAFVYEGRGRELAVRRECLTSLAFDLIDRRADRLVIESREGMDHFDRSCIAHALIKAAGDLDYVHVRPHHEPCLWVPDALAWAYGAGGDWRRRAQPAIELARDLGNVA